MTTPVLSSRCRETPIGALKTLLLDLLCKRAELLSQPIEIEVHHYLVFVCMVLIILIQFCNLDCIQHTLGTSLSGYHGNLDYESIPKEPP